MTTRSISTKGYVFVSCQIADFSHVATFCALVAAVNGEGSVAITDLAETDPLMYSSQIEYRNANLACSVLHGLCIILDMYAKSDAGAIAAVVFTKGVHSTLVVVGHNATGNVVGGHMAQLQVREALRRHL